MKHDSGKVAWCLLILGLDLSFLLAPAQGWHVESAAETRAKTESSESIKRYLEAEYSCSIKQVVVSRESIDIRGKTPWPLSEVSIREVLLSELSSGPHSQVPKKVQTDEAGAFRLRCSRIEAARDRVTSRWQVVEKDSGSALSPATWCTTVPLENTELPPLPELRNAKGLGGIDSRFGLPELVELGIQHLTVNVIISDLLAESSASQSAGGVDEQIPAWTLRAERLAEIDRVVRFASEHDIVVAAILLIPQASQDAIVHPKATSAAPYSMPNLTHERSTQKYSAVIRKLAERYSKPNMRIDHWIAHNEVDFAWQWTNMGEQPIEVMVEHYYRSMRIIDLEIRRQNPQAQVFVSLTHHFNNPAANWRNYSGRDILELLAKWSLREGNFDWGIAYHPYPPSLFHPMQWPAEVVSNGVDTEKITMKNLQVLAEFLASPNMLAPNKERRTVLLSEQGYHAPKSEPHAENSAEELQARALLFAWQRLRETDFVTAFDYHRWVDHPQEGGLRLGLRDLPTKDRPYGPPKIGWHVFRDLATPKEQEWRERFAGEPGSSTPP